jgi:hypothetical protein
VFTKNLIDAMGKCGLNYSDPSSCEFIEIKPGPAAKQQRKVLALWHALGYDMDKLHTRVKSSSVRTDSNG